MNDPVKVLARELYVADHVHQYALILIKSDKLEKSYNNYREKILANAPFDTIREVDQAYYINQAERLLK